MNGLIGYHEKRFWPFIVHDLLASADWTACATKS